jgi:two-component system response regulator HydG
MKRILIVDDEIDLCMLLERFLAKHGYAVTTALDGGRGLKLLEQTPFELVISDFRLPDMDGLGFLKKAKRIKPECKVIVITGYSDIRMAVEVIKYGAVDYITKPLYPEELLSLIQETLKHKAPQLHIDLQDEADGGAPGSKYSASAHSKTAGAGAYLIGRSEMSQKLHDDIELVAPTPMSVIITGETGTGKEFVAKRIHELSNRADKAFVAIDCGALPKDIADSEFFGHEQGAFTGALKAKDGKFKAADGGTLFLDEIGNLSYEIQIKLLRVLQEQKVTRVGGTKDISVDVRIIVASNESLKDAVLKGTFREDLYYRLNEFSMEVQPLRDRSDDLIDFTKRFIAQANTLLSRDVKQLSPEVWEKFEVYSWPGNLRELRNILKRCVLLAKSDTVGLETLPEEIAYHKAPTGGTTTRGAHSLREAAEEAERERIVKVLSQTGNNKSKAARMLNIDRKTLYNKLKSYGI